MTTTPAIQDALPTASDPAVRSTVLLGDCTHDRTIVVTQINEEGEEVFAWIECPSCGEILLP